MVEEEPALMISKINPPTIIGMLKRKLYSALFSCDSPAIKSEQIVLPEREIPGKTAKPWTIPTIIADLVLISLFALIIVDFWVNLCVKTRRIPVIKKQNP